MREKCEIRNEEKRREEIKINYILNNLTHGILFANEELLNILNL